MEVGACNNLIDCTGNMDRTIYHVKFDLKVGQSGTKYDKSGDFSDQNSVH